VHKLVGPEPVEQMGSPYLFVLMGKEHLEIITDADVIPNAVPVEELQPLFAHELPVRDHGFDDILSKKPDKPAHKLYALLTIGIPPLVQHGEQQWKSDAFVHNTEHEYIDIGLPKLPVGPVNAQDEPALFGQKAKDKAGYKVRI
tara:strand:+ start:436 stop:867 length:432 start_codon:yes stop_codon:yes gene_type:complete